MNLLVTLYYKMYRPTDSMYYKDGELPSNMEFVGHTDKGRIVRVFVQAVSHIYVNDVENAPAAIQKAIKILFYTNEWTSVYKAKCQGHVEFVKGGKS